MPPVSSVLGRQYSENQFFHASLSCRQRGLGNLWLSNREHNVIELHASLSFFRSWGLFKKTTHSFGCSVWLPWVCAAWYVCMYKVPGWGTRVGCFQHFFSRESPIWRETPGEIIKPRASLCPKTHYRARSGVKEFPISGLNLGFFNKSVIGSWLDMANVQNANHLGLAHAFVVNLESVDWFRFKCNSTLVPTSIANAIIGLQWRTMRRRGV